jgi:hypothetical protein
MGFVVVSKVCLCVYMGFVIVSEIIYTYECGLCLCLKLSIPMNGVCVSV